MPPKLNLQEKYIIQGMLNDEFPIEKIAKELNRHTKTIKHYVDNELKTLRDTIHKVKLEQIEALEQEINDTTVEKPKKRDPKNKGFINKTGGGQKGIAVSTEAASSQSDVLRAMYPTEFSRHVRGNVYKIDEQEIQ